MTTARNSEMRASKAITTSWRYRSKMIHPATASTSRTHAAAVTNRRSASELGFIDGEAVAKPPYGLDHVGRDLLAQAADEHLDGVGVAVEVLLVEVLDQLAAGHHALVVVHEIGEQPVLVRGELDGLAIEGDAGGLGVEAQRPALDV